MYKPGQKQGMLFSGGRKNGTIDGCKDSSDIYLLPQIFIVREDWERQESRTIGEEKEIGRREKEEK